MQSRDSRQGAWHRFCRSFRFSRRRRSAVGGDGGNQPVRTGRCRAPLGPQRSASFKGDKADQGVHYVDNLWSWVDLASKVMDIFYIQSLHNAEACNWTRAASFAGFNELVCAWYSASGYPHLAPMQCSQPAQSVLQCSQLHWCPDARQRNPFPMPAFLRQIGCK